MRRQEPARHRDLLGKDREHRLPDLIHLVCGELNPVVLRELILDDLSELDYGSAGKRNRINV